MSKGRRFGLRLVVHKFGGRRPKVQWWQRLSENDTGELHSGPVKSEGRSWGQ